MKYNPALDGVRAVAVLAVIAHHCFVPYFWNGRCGVDVFFVLSGFLITSLLLREAQSGGIRLGAFYLRRARRLYPALLLMVGLVMAAGPLLHSYAPTGRDAVFTLLYLSDYAAAFESLGDAFKHTWSLAIEEQFYLVWPLVVMGLARLPKRTAVLLLVAAYLLVSAWRLNVDGWAAYYRFDTHASGLILGAMLAFAPRIELPHAKLALLMALLVYITRLELLAVTAAEACGAFLVLGAVQGSRVLAWRPLVYLGRISYGLYLFHWPIALLVRDPSDWPRALVMTLAGGILLASASYYTVERIFRVPRRPVLTLAHETL
jgi:peptidoglycan/LPS O-acetylase OafA/YrhL